MDIMQLILNEVKHTNQVLNEHGEILKEHSEILKEHGAILKEHSEILKEHSAILNEHGVILNKHDEALKSIKMRLVSLEDTVRLTRGIVLEIENDWNRKVNIMLESLTSTTEKTNNHSERIDKLEHRIGIHDIMFEAVDKRIAGRA